MKRWTVEHINFTR